MKVRQWILIVFLTFGWLMESDGIPLNAVSIRCKRELHPNIGVLRRQRNEGEEAAQHFPEETENAESFGRRAWYAKFASPMKQEGPKRNATYDPTYGYEPYWEDGNWVINRTKTAEKDCGQPCMKLYTRFGPVCGQDKNFTTKSFNTYCEMLSENCDGTQIWTILYRGECDVDLPTYPQDLNRIMNSYKKISEDWMYRSPSTKKIRSTRPVQIGHVMKKMDPGPGGPAVGPSWMDAGFDLEALDDDQIYEPPSTIATEGPKYDLYFTNGPLYAK